MSWLLIDDNIEEADSFAEQISTGDTIIIRVTAADTQAKLTAGSLDAAGVLMDVDLSNDSEARTTGPGLAQNCRVAMHQLRIPSFPIVRFSWREKVAASIGHDPSSDDLFDMKVEKDGLENEAVMATLRGKLSGLEEVYRSAETASSTTELLGVNEDTWEAWGHDNFASRLAQADRPYLRAGLIVRLLCNPGLLISEELLSFRLGVDRALTDDWENIIKAVERARYVGAGARAFPRWWARGISHWWGEIAPRDPPLPGTTVEERISILSKMWTGIAPLSMPANSPGERPWRTCLLTYEQEGRLIPVDPDKAVRMESRSEMPPWLDPLYAALGPAMRASRHDSRINQADVKRLTLVARRLL